METSDTFPPPFTGEVDHAKRGGGGGRAHLPPPLRCAQHLPRFTGEENAGDIVATARGWIGTPYVHQASVKGVGCDCLGLLRGVWRELRGAEPQAVPNYSPDWAEATGAETLYMALARILWPVPLHAIAPGDIALFRMHPRGPAKHCGIIATFPPPFTAEGDREAVEGAHTLIHARQNKRVSEETFSPLWRSKLTYLFTFAPAGASRSGLG